MKQNCFNNKVSMMNSLISKIWLIQTSILVTFNKFQIFIRFNQEIWSNE